MTVQTRSLFRSTSIGQIQKPLLASPFMFHHPVRFGMSSSLPDKYSGRKRQVLTCHTGRHSSSMLLFGSCRDCDSNADQSVRPRLIWTTLVSVFTHWYLWVYPITKTALSGHCTALHSGPYFSGKRKLEKGRNVLYGIQSCQISRSLCTGRSTFY